MYIDSFSIINPPSIVVNATTTNLNCFGGNGTATLTLSGGTGTLTVDWFGSNPNALAAGVYPYTVTDVNGCVFIGSVTIT